MLLLGLAALSVASGLALEGDLMDGPTDREDAGTQGYPRVGCDPNLVTLFESTNPKKIRKFLVSGAGCDDVIPPRPWVEWFSPIPPEEPCTVSSPRVREPSPGRPLRPDARLRRLPPAPPRIVPT
jgi:hypothetical protein